MSELLPDLATNAPFILRTLLLYELQVTVFALIVWGIDRWLRRAYSGFRYALWLVVLVKALWPPSFAIPRLDILPAVPIALPALAVTATGSGIPLQQSSLPPAAISLLAWGLMSAGLLVLMLISFVAFKLRLRAPHSYPWQPDVDSPPKGKRWPPIWYTDRIPSPLTLGLIRPRIYLTPKAAAADPATLEAILHHELAHIRRRDGWITLLQAVALVIHPFNPLVWLMNRRLTSYREQVCDDFALRHTGIAPHKYGQVLIDQLRRSVPSPLMLHPRTLFFETKRDLKQRLQQLLNREEGTMNTHTTTKQKLLLAGLMAGLLIIASQCSEKSELAAPAVSVAPAASQVTPPTRTPDARVIPYDEAPAPVGGFQALQQQVEYPEEAKAAGVQGTVVVYAFIDENGQVQETRIIQGTDTVLDEAAVAAIKSTTFRSAKREGEPVGVWLSMPIMFRLPGEAVDESSDETSSGQIESTGSEPQPPRIIGGAQAYQEALALAYPEQARAAGIEGNVVVSAFITKEGKVGEVRVEENFTGDASLAEAAAAVIKSLSFEPGREMGNPVDTWFTAPVRFRLDE